MDTLECYLHNAMFNHHRYRQTSHRQTDRQTDRQTSHRQTDKQTNRTATPTAKREVVTFG